MSQVRWDLPGFQELCQFNVMVDRVNKNDKTWDYILWQRCIKKKTWTNCTDLCFFNVVDWFWYLFLLFLFLCIFSIVEMYCYTKCKIWWYLIDIVKLVARSPIKNIYKKEEDMGSKKDDNECKVCVNTTLIIPCATPGFFCVLFV